MNRALLAVVLLALGCGSSPAPDPTITITSPHSNDTVALGIDADKTVPITYAVTNFTVGDTTNAAASGHVHLLIDGPACSGTGIYNNTSIASPTANALFAKCSNSIASGTSHTVTLELHNDAHQPVVDSSGAQIKTSVTFKLQ